jgi:hypothetical protein
VWLCLFLGLSRAGAQDADLAKELGDRARVEQEARKDLIEFMAKNGLTWPVDADKLKPPLAKTYRAVVARVDQADRDNLKWLKAVVARHGWPAKSLVGTDAARDAWLLVQHADKDRDFQESCLKKMAALPSGEVDPQHVAYLTDRVLVGRGKKQKYGTQVLFKEGKAVAAPLEDCARVDERRRAIGLEPLADYLKTTEALYKKGEGLKPVKAQPKGP